MEIQSPEFSWGFATAPHASFQLYFLHRRKKVQAKQFHSHLKGRQQRAQESTPPLNYVPSKNGVFNEQLVQGTWTLSLFKVVTCHFLKLNSAPCPLHSICFQSQISYMWLNSLNQRPPTLLFPVPLAFSSPPGFSHFRDLSLILGLTSQLSVS